MQNIRPNPENINVVNSNPNANQILNSNNKLANNVLGNRTSVSIDTSLSASTLNIATPVTN